MATLPQLRERIGRVVDALRPVPALEARRGQLAEWLGGGSDDARLRIGVVGVTSSGKTTLVNALLGERLLPEEAPATTNTLVQCRRGPVREVTVRHAAGGPDTRLTGEAVTPAALAELTSERHNPGNARGIAAVDVALPGALLPEGLVVIDSPGLDALGLEELEALALQRLLPTADIIVFVASIRRPFRPSEMELLQRCVREDQRVLFLLNQADLERDSRGGGRVLRRREQRLQEHTDALAALLEQFPNLRSYGTAVISAKQAQAGRGTKAWEQSGFDQVLGYLQAFRADLAGVLAASRARTVAPLLGRAAEELAHHLDTAPAQDDTARLLAEREARAEELSEAAEEAAISIGFEYESWNGQLDPDGWQREMAEAFEGYSDRRVDEFQAAMDERRRAWHDLREGLLAALMEAESELMQSLGRFELAPDHRGERHRRPEGDPFPAMDPYVWTSTEVYEVEQPRAWSEGGLFMDWLRGRRQERRERLVRHLNIPALLVEINAYLRRGAEEVRHHLRWWKAHTERAYVEVLRAAAEGEARAINDLRDEALHREREREAARRALGEIEQARAWIAQALDLPAPEAVRPEPTAAAPANGHAPAPPSRLALAATALRPVLTTTWEASYARLWRLVLDEAAPGIARPRVLLLGPRRENHLGLCAALARRLEDLPAWRSRDEAAWLWIGREPAIALPGPAEPLATGGDWDVVVAPADALAACDSWTGLLGAFDAVGIECDAPRISCGLKELHGAPYAEAARALGRRVFLCCGDAGLFADRLHELVHRVLPLADAHAPFATSRPWFLHEVESYDARATALALAARRDPAALPALWQRLGLSWAPPFTRSRLEALAAETSGKVAAAA